MGEDGVWSNIPIVPHSWTSAVTSYLALMTQQPRSSMTLQGTWGYRGKDPHYRPTAPRRWHSPGTQTGSRTCSDSMTSSSSIVSLNHTAKRLAVATARVTGNRYFAPVWFRWKATRWHFRFSSLRSFCLFTLLAQREQTIAEPRRLLLITPTTITSRLQKKG